VPGVVRGYPGRIKTARCPVKQQRGDQMTRLLLIIAVMHLTVHAQDSTQSIEDEIKNTRQSPIVTILNSRHLLLLKIKSNDVQKVHEILNYLDKNIDTTTYNAFYSLEKVLIDILTYDFVYIRHPEMLDSIMTQRENGKIYPQEDGLYIELKKVLSKNRETVGKKALSIQLSEDERAFLNLFIDLIVLEDENKQTHLNDKSDVFLSAYPESKFDHFVRHYIRYVYKPSKFGLGFAFFSGRTFMTGGLKEHFSNHSPLGVMFDVYYRNFVLFLVDHIGIPSDTKKDFTVGDDTWPEGTAVNMFLPSLEIGYQFTIFNRLFISPFIGISSQYFTACEAEKKKGIDVSSPWTAAFTMGLNTDIAVFKRKGRTRFSMVSMNESAHWTLRIRAGYSDARFESKYSELFSGGIVFLQIGVGGFSHPIKRDL
jgi:hypothetical protein